MAGQTYQVNYIVNVDATNAQTAVNTFKRALASMDKATKPILDLQRKVRGLVETMSTLSRGQYTVKIDTSQATKKIGKLVAGLKTAQKEVVKLNSLGIQFAGATQKQQRSQSRTRTTPAPVAAPRRVATPSVTPVRATPRYGPAVRGTSNLGYKLWGPTPLPNNGGMAIDMLKGMGIAYGIAGLGMAISNIVSEATEYDNLMKTVENILKSHDEKGNFGGRFASMTQTIRNVGMETKFKVTEVADAAKFLAMAGLDLESIQRSIRPIADIALVGDTELGKTADLVTNIMTAYNIAPEKMRLAADVMTNTFTMSNTTLTEIAEAYKYAASLLSAGGVSFEEATAAIGVLGDAGIKGSQAGTTMRTIMANIVNPTKKQKAAWDAIGVNRYDKQGNLKDLIQIFKELNAAGLGVADYYRLFHKTAASGAVALSTHVNKWDNVLVENMMAGGLSSRLAEEKKNTIQGLWAQLTSVFTDNGVTAFANVQESIKNFLKTTIAWLKTEDAKNAINKVAEAMMSFVKIMKDVSEFFYTFYKMAGPWIMTWMKFQLYIWPVVKTITAFRSVMLGILGLKKVGATVLYLANSFRLLKASTTGLAAVGTATTATSSAAMAGMAGVSGGRVMTPYGIAGLPWLPALTDKQYAAAAKGLNLKAPLPVKQGMTPRISEYLREKNREYYKGLQDRQKIYNRRVMTRQALVGAGNVAGMIGVGVGASMMMDEEYGTAGKVSGGLLGAAGMTAMMATGPVGWTVAGVLALGSAIFYVAEKMNQMAEAGKRITQMASEFKVVEDHIVNENMSDAARYLTMIYQKNYNIDEVLQLRIKHTRELLGLESQPTPTDNSASTDRFLRAFNDINGAYDGSRKYLNEQNNADALKLLGVNAYVDSNGNYHFGMDGDDFQMGGVAMAGNLAIASEVANGTYTQQLFEEFGKQQQKAILENDVEGLRRLATLFTEKWGPQAWNEKNYNRSTHADDWRKMAENPADFAANGLYQRMVYNRFVGDFGGENGAINALNTFHQALNSNSSDLVSAFVNLLGYAGPGGLTMENYGLDTTWLANNGWNGYTFVPVGENLNGFEQATVVLKQIEDLAVIMRRLGLYDSDNEGVKTMLGDIETLRKNAEGYIALTQGKPLPEGWVIPDGFTVPFNGTNYRWDAATETFNELMSDEDLASMISSPIANAFLRSYGSSGALGFDWGNAYGWNVSANFSSGFSGSFSPITDNSGWIPGAMNGGISYLLGCGFTGIGSLGFDWGSSYGWSVGTNFNAGFNSGFGASTGFGGGLGVGAGGGFFNGGFTSIGLGNGVGGLFTSGTRNYFQDSFMRNMLQRTGGVLKPMGRVFTLPQLHTGFANQRTPVNTPAPSTPTTTPSGGGGSGTKSSDYKSHERERAVPKQININIQNLMNVDNIDLSNPDNVAVIDRVKREVAYALYEAAADGTTMINGLANS